ncbi:NAD-dependent epimerase/dehydratase family protein [Halalkaliarchaeum desulfuricum]|uniref:NAD-dependent epimerase/dehydratase family protein n=1 Tax=Halalkaliarchaeum desulfuricum TaxID=2055893 RepID=UPI000E6B4E9A|nr:NAD-dependent epimerase/dehydratase family protein [Halalkaliarchaeum desulfuricum]
METPHESHTINATGTLNVLDAAREHDVRVVVASSAAIYGHPEDTPIDESHPKEPTSPYGLDKLTADHYTRLYHDLYDLDTVALRYFNVYGPGQTGGDYAGVVSVFIEQALAGDDITVHGEGDQTRDFVFVEDVVRANLAAARTDHVGEAYNVGTGESVSIRELAELIQDLTDTDSDIVHTDPREGDIDHSRADISTARAKLDFEPTVSLREGLERTIEWFEPTE